jgi:hypothetical protein
VTEEMSGGLRHHNDEERAEPCGWTQIIRSKIITLTGETSASALTGKVCAKLQDQEAKVP